MIKDCPKHGSVKFNLLGQGNNQRWRCSPCQIEAVNKRRKKLKVLAIDYKGGECEDCGYNKSPSALEFHHIDPTMKEFGISGNGITRSIETIKTELDKCLLLCANCHREEHDYLDVTGLKVSLIGVPRLINGMFMDVSS